MPGVPSPGSTRLALAASALLLSGCDLAAASALMPGLLPGVGWPVAGVVLDSRTRLPIGGATVASGLGSTVTGNDGRFALYGNLGSREISAVRAGYVARTLGGRDLAGLGAGDVEILLDWQYKPEQVQLPNRSMEVQGTIEGGGSGVAALMGVSQPISNGTFTLQVAGGFPGDLLTAVLAYGQVSGSYADNPAAPQPFSFTRFGYLVHSFKLTQAGQPAPEKLKLRYDAGVQFAPVTVTYTNLGALSRVTTNLALDFGLAGTVPIGRATASSQAIQAPQIAGLKYVIDGEAADDTRTRFSRVTYTTNSPGKAPFPLLSVPEAQAPANGATGVGGRPTFRWKPTNGRSARYLVTLQEVDKASSTSVRKWTGDTDLDEIAYPGFSLADLNGGALRPDRSYVWSVQAVDLSDPATGAAWTLAPPNLKPYRLRSREAEHLNQSFTP